MKMGISSISLVFFLLSSVALSDPGGYFLSFIDSEFAFGHVLLFPQMLLNNFLVTVDTHLKKSPGSP